MKTDLNRDINKSRQSSSTGRRRPANRPDSSWQSVMDAVRSRSDEPADSRAASAARGRGAGDRTGDYARGGSGFGAGRRDTTPGEAPRAAYTTQQTARAELLTGLTQAEVAERVSQGLVNKASNDGRRTTGQIIRAHTLTYFNFLNIFLGVLVFLTGEYKNMLFLGVIVCNSLIGIVQEMRVKKLIDNLSVVTASRCTVIRDGRRQEIPVEDIVTDDLVVLRPGDQLAADGTVVEADGLELNESLLTGESHPVIKSPGDSLLSGSFISAGTGIQKVDNVGAACYASKLVKKAQVKHRASSEMQVTIGRIIKVVSIIIIPIGLLLFWSQRAANPDDMSNAIVRTVSGVLGMIPEGLVLLTSVSFIIGVGRLAMKRALVQEMESIEALARVTVLCTDKTGTITTGKLQVHEVIPFGNETEETVSEVIREINAAFSDTNNTQDALIQYFGQTTSWVADAKIPFSSAWKYRAVSFRGRGAYVIGAPEFLIAGREDMMEIIDSYSDRGYRVLILGRTTSVIPAGEKTSSTASGSAPSTLTSPVSARSTQTSPSIGPISPMAAIVISDVIKTDAIEVFQSFSEAGVAVKVISGDNPRTVSSVAMKAGVKDAGKYVDASTLPSRLEDLRKVISDYTIFGRVKPEQKQLFVKAWQMNGETVAMVGDGVNDVLAIKDADCGIAMAAGSEAAKQAAHIVLLDSDFKAMKDIVSEGRTIISNIERVSSLYLTKTIYSILLCLIFILLKRSYPFTTLQIGLINICCIGMPSFLLTLKQQENAPTHGFLRNVLKVAAPSALTMVTMMLVVQILRAIFGWNLEIYSTFTLMLGGLVGLLVVLEVMWPMDLFDKIIFGASCAVFIAAILFLPGFYDVHHIWMWWSLLLIPLGFATLWLITRFDKLMTRWNGKIYEKVTALWNSRK